MTAIGMRLAKLPINNPKPATVRALVAKTTVATQLHFHPRQTAYAKMNEKIPNVNQSTARTGRRNVNIDGTPTSAAIMGDTAGEANARPSSRPVTSSMIPNATSNTDNIVTLDGRSGVGNSKPASSPLQPTGPVKKPSATG